MTTPQNKLPCGCIKGEYLCPTAEMLWADANFVYTKHGYGPEYMAALRKYDAHIWDQTCKSHHDPTKCQCCLDGEDWGHEDVRWVKIQLSSPHIYTERFQSYVCRKHLEYLFATGWTYMPGFIPEEEGDKL